MEHVVIPRIQNTIQYIKKILDEQAREDFYRQKKLTDKKKKAKEINARKAALKVAEEKHEENQEEEPSAITEAIGEEDKDDLIF